MAASTTPAALAGYRSGLAWLGKAEIVVTCLLVFFMIAAVTAEVIFRYLLASSLFWVEEAAMIAFIWITFLGAAVATKARRHIVIQTFGSRLHDARAAIAWSALGHLIVLTLAILVAVYSYSYTSIQARTLTVSLPVNVPRSWMFAWPLFFGMCSIALTSFYYLMDNLIRFRRSDDSGLAGAILEV
jgi:TRAP-type C4-dicarboxylate transport system permease small subunit